MKPIYIEMKAFGSYRDEKIDFTGKSQGLFLITGDTGAGKPQFLMQYAMRYMGKPAVASAAVR